MKCWIGRNEIRPRVTSTAAGRYQIIYKTLARLVDSYGIDPDLLFDAAMQDRLGELLLEECGYGQRDSIGLCRLPGANLGRVAARDRTERRALGTRRNCRQPGPGDTGSRHGVSRRRPHRQPAPGGLAASVTADLPRASFEYSAVRGAIEREIKAAHENETLGRSVVVRMAVDPYRTR